MSFKPRQDYPYWMINSRFEIRQTVHNGSRKSHARIDAGNCFSNREKAFELLEVIKSYRPMSRWQHLKKAIFG